MRTVDYGYDTSLTMDDGAFVCGYRRARAMCSDGKVRIVHFSNGGIADTFFSIPGYIYVNKDRVRGFVTVETADGYSTPSTEDPAVVKFVAREGLAKSDLLPKGAWRRPTPIDPGILELPHVAESKK